MNKREQEQFAAYFEEIYQTEEVLDFIKLQLAQSISYNPNILFDLISGKTETISIQHIRAYLQDKVACNERQLYEIFERFDWSRQGVICRSDFLNEIVPFGKQNLPLNLTGGSLTAEIEGHFISLLIEILKRFRIVEVVRKQLKYIQPYDAFKHIDYLKTGFIGIAQLRKLFFENDFNVTDKQLYYLLHGLRRRCYRDINLEVFCQNLEPLEFGYYIAFQNNIDEQIENEFVNKSRHQQEAMKRSRVQAQRIEHQYQKAERKKQAELKRQLELEDRVTAEILQHEEQKEKQIKRALLEEDRQIRYNMAAGDLYQQQRLNRSYEKHESQYLNNMRLRQQSLNDALASSAMKRQQELEHSRRALDRERDMLYSEEMERKKNLLRSTAVDRQFELSKRRIEEESRRRYEDDLYRRMEEQNLRRYDPKPSIRKAEEDSYLKMLEASRKHIEESRRQKNQEDRRIQQSSKKAYEDHAKNRENFYRDLELQRQRARQEIAHIRNNRIAQYQKQLEKTRYDVYDRSIKKADLSVGYR